MSKDNVLVGEDKNIIKEFRSLRKDVKLANGRYIRRLALVVGEFEDLLNLADDITDANQKNDASDIVTRYETALVGIGETKLRLDNALEKLRIAERDLTVAAESFNMKYYFGDEDYSKQFFDTENV